MNKFTQESAIRADCIKFALLLYGETFPNSASSFKSATGRMSLQSLFDHVQGCLKPDTSIEIITCSGSSLAMSLLPGREGTLGARSENVV